MESNAFFRKSAFLYYKYNIKYNLNTDIIINIINIFSKKAKYCELMKSLFKIDSNQFAGPGNMTIP